tara:strand:+ start:294 stop:983 length:690 start_codon:yes stop_codon:yes gene_type:complete
MRTEINISVPKPCHEKWNDMSINEKGRHCIMCKKTVVDFTNNTDEAIVDYFLEHKNICGRFKTQQLNRPVVLSRKSKNNYWSLAASGILGILSLIPTKLKAQENINQTQKDTTEIQMTRGKVMITPPTKKIITGLVLDDNGLPLPAATILIENTSIGTSTDFDGNFTLKAYLGDVLVVTYVGYTSQKIHITDSTDYEIILAPDKTLKNVVPTALGFVRLNEIQKRHNKK